MASDRQNASIAKPARGRRNAMPSRPNPASPPASAHRVNPANPAPQMAAINSVIEVYGKSERNKYRAVVYYMLTKHFGKEAVYG